MSGVTISVMLAVEDAPKAIQWYKLALGAIELWNFGAVAAIEIGGSPLFLAQPAKNGWEAPTKLGLVTARIELFCDNPEAVISRALEAGATGSMQTFEAHQRPWGTHWQGGFTDPFGHIWLVGDRSPLQRFPS